MCSTAAQRVPAPEGSGDEVDELVIFQHLVDRPEIGIPELVTVGQQHLEDAALRIRATDHGASMEFERVRCAVGGSETITHDDGAARERASRKLSVLPRPRRHSSGKPPASAVKFAPGSNYGVLSPAVDRTARVIVIPPGSITQDAPERSGGMQTAATVIVANGDPAVDGSS